MPIVQLALFAELEHVGKMEMAFADNKKVDEHDAARRSNQKICLLTIDSPKED